VVSERHGSREYAVDSPKLIGVGSELELEEGVQCRVMQVEDGHGGGFDLTLICLAEGSGPTTVQRIR
jgi:hypothetical protein